MVRAVAVIAVVLAIGVTIALLYINSASGQKEFAAWAGDYLSGQETTVKFGSIEGSLFSDFTLSSLTVADSRGVWFSLQKAKLSWSPWALVSRRVAIQNMTIKAARLQRLPADKGVAQSTVGDQSDLSFALPTLPVDINISVFGVELFEFGRDILTAQDKFQIHGSLSLIAADGAALQAEMSSLSKNVDQITVHVAQTRVDNNLDVDVSVRAAKGGGFASLAGIDADQEMLATFQGVGPLDDWSGKLNAQIGATNIASATVLLKNGGLSVRARLDGGDYIPDIGAAILGRTADLSFDISSSKETPRRSVTLELVADTVKLSAKGNLTPSNLTADEDIDFTLEILDAAPFNRRLLPLFIKPTSVSGVLRNIKGDPTVTAQLATTHAAYGSDAQADIGGTFDLTLRQSTLEVKAKGMISKVKVPSFDKMGAIVKPDLQWAGSGVLSRDDASFTLEKLVIENINLKLDAVGAYEAQVGALDMDFSTVLADVGTVIPNAGGQAILSVEVSREAAGSTLQTVIDLVSENFSIAGEPIAQIIGRNPRLSAHASLMPDGSIEVREVNAQGAQVSLVGKANLTPDQSFHSTSFMLTLSGMETVAAENSYVIEGGISLTADISGPLVSPSLTVMTSLKQLEVQSIYFRDLVASARADDVFTRPHGQLSVTGMSDVGALMVDSAFNLDPEKTMKFNSVAASLGQYHVVGELSVPRDQPIRGSLALTTKASGDESVDRRKQLSGEIDAQIDLTGASGLQQVEIEGKIKDVAAWIDDSELLTVKAGKLSANILFTEFTPEMSGDAEFYEVVYPTIQAEVATVKLKRIGRRHEFDAQIQGAIPTPYNLRFLGSAINDQGEAKVDVAVEGTVAQTLVRSQTPLQLSLSGGGFSLDPFALRLGDGQVGGSLTAANQRLLVDLKIDRTDLTPLQSFLPELPLTGLLSGTANLDASAASARGSFGFTLTGVRADSGTTLLDPNLTISVAGDIEDNTMSLSGGMRLENVVDVDFSGILPVDIDVAPYGIDLIESEPVFGEIAWKGDIGMVWPAFDLINHDLSGSLDMKLILGGTLQKPDIDGAVDFKNGRYESTQTGFVATDIDLTAKVNDRRFVIERLTAGDGSNGTLDIDGFVDILPDFSIEAEANLTLDKARLVRRPRLNVMASSTLKFRKNASTAELVGDVSVDNADVGAWANGGPTIIELDVREINGNGRYANRQEIQTGNHLGPITLDINFRAPGKLFIRSYGLDSEWSSTLKMTGSSQAPIFAGSATLIRGTFDFSGKRFRLVRGGLTFPTDGSNDPILDISAEHQLPDLTAILAISGTASSPILEVSSTPALPQDEILSRIFFGTSVAALSPIEAVQLAETVHSLSTGGGPGLIGGFRRTLGIDRLAIDQDATREYGTTITGGKYLTNNVYVEVTTAPATGETATAVEVGLSKNLSLITRRTLDHDNNLAIRWSWSY